MPAHREQIALPYTPAQLFALVADVERYPEFLPWCKAARILSRESDAEFLAELLISFKGFSERYTSRVRLAAPERIDVEMVKGPFEYLVNHWRFTPHGEGALLDFTVDFRFRSRLLEAMIGGIFARATQKMTQAFTERAEELYGRESADSIVIPTERSDEGSSHG